MKRGPATLIFDSQLCSVGKQHFGTFFTASRCSPVKWGTPITIPRVDFGTMCEECFYHVLGRAPVVCRRREMKWCPTVIVRRRCYRSMVQQQPHQIRLAGASRPMQRSIATVVRSHHVSLMVEKHLNGVNMTIPSSQVKRRATAFAGFQVNLGFMVEKQLYDGGVSLFRGQMQWSETQLVCGMYVG